MRRNEYGVSETVISRLISDVLLARAPNQLHLLATLGREPLSLDERETIRGILADELVAVGLDPDDEPNERGQLIETAIDWLGHQ
jgi:hypothetical protein